MSYFKLPDLGEGLSEAEIVEWQVKPGDTVEADQILLTVETAKALVEVPSPRAGVIAHCFGEAGDIVHTGEPLVEFSGDEAGAKTAKREDRGSVVGNLESSAALYGEERVAPSAAAATVRATPAVRALAQRLGVDLGAIAGGGPGGLIQVEDVESAARLTESHGAAEPLRGVRRAMAQNLSRARDEVAQVTLTEDVDVSAWYRSGVDTTMQLVRAIAAACEAEPALNAWFDGRAMTRRLLPQVDLGIAVDTPDGLFVPVLRNISGRDLTDLRAGLDRLRSDVKARTIPPEELRGASFVLSNFGTLGGRYATTMVVPPSVAILGAGRVRQQPWVDDDGELCVRPVLPLSLSVDHRCVTGGEAARFLRALIDALSDSEATGS